MRTKEQQEAINAKLRARAAFKKAAINRKGVKTVLFNNIHKWTMDTSLNLNHCVVIEK